MKTLAVVTTYENTSLVYRQTLETIFAGHLQIDTFQVGNEYIGKGLDADVVVISSNTLIGYVKKRLVRDSIIIAAQKTITREGFKMIDRLPEGTEGLLVNVTEETTYETLTLFYGLWGSKYNLEPYYPGIPQYRRKTLALTPAESCLVPDCVTRTIDFGDRLLDLSTIYEIVHALDLDHATLSDRIRRYGHKIVPLSRSFDEMVRTSQTLKSQVDLMMRVMDEAMVIVDQGGMINLCNAKAERIFSRLQFRLRKDTDIFDIIPLPGKLGDVKNTLVRVRGSSLIVDTYTIADHSNPPAYAIRVRSYDEAEKLQQRIRAKYLEKGLVARYSFQDIVGKSSAITECIRIAEKMALSDASILIAGESGTGKELFSQAIHHASQRSAKPFVAINCAAIPESLLESELFGYDEGAFTGARKGGKAGLFEIAHEGTVFLDEIGEMPLSLQARLLRVLQEKCVMRVGGSRVIPIDVRVIAATNRHLKEEVERQTFRKDLFYRLNVLPMVLPPLREHSEDIPELIATMKNQLGATFTIDSALMADLLDYEWDGNIRELQNLIAYLFHLGKPFVSARDLPHGTELRKKAQRSLKVLPQKVPGSYDNLHGYALWQVYWAGRDGRRIGRRSLHDCFVRSGHTVSEREVRAIIADLAQQGYLRIGSGRGGTQITEKGIGAIKTGQKTGSGPFLTGQGDKM